MTKMSKADTSCQTIIACKNCIHFDWSIQLCHLWAMYHNDDDRCASFVSVYDVYDTSHTSKIGDSDD